MTVRDASSTAVTLRAAPWRGWGGRALSSYETAIYAALLLVIVAVSVATPRFLSPDNLFEVARNFSFIAAVGVGEAIVIITGGGGIDLSVGSVMGLGRVRDSAEDEILELIVTGGRGATTSATLEAGPGQDP
ncbi:MAG TPA: hypothetical protein VEP50_03225 [bacterium]|nr:hypothetical protein [bacterium]